MKKLFTLIAISAIVTSCSQTSEQSASEADLKLFASLTARSYNCTNGN